MSRFVRTVGSGAVGGISLSTCAINTQCSITTTCNFCGNAKGLCNTRLDLIATCTIPVCTIGGTLTFTLPTNCYSQFNLLINNLYSPCGSMCMFFGNDNFFCGLNGCLRYCYYCFNFSCVIRYCTAATGCMGFPINLFCTCTIKTNLDINLRQAYGNGGNACLGFSGSICSTYSNGSCCFDFIDFMDAYPGCSNMHWIPSCPGTTRFTRLQIFGNCSNLCSQGDLYWELYGRKYQCVTYTNVS